MSRGAGFRRSLAGALLAAAVAGAASPPVGAEEGSAGSDPASWSVRAMVVARKKAMLSAEIAGRVAEVTVRTGDGFRQGQRLVSFDCVPFRARVKAAEAAQAAAEISLATAERMLSLKSIGRQDVDLARTEVDKAAAELAIRRFDAGNCVIEAPFAGRVTEVVVHAHESVKQGTELLAILDHRDLELEVLVPSVWLRWIGPGTPFTVRLDATERAYGAVVDRIGAEVDTASRSVRVFGRFAAPPDGVLAGMSGAVRFERPDGGEPR